MRPAVSVALCYSERHSSLQQMHLSGQRDAETTSGDTVHYDGYSRCARYGAICVCVSTGGLHGDIHQSVVLESDAVDQGAGVYGVAQREARPRDAVADRRHAGPPLRPLRVPRNREQRHHGVAAAESSPGMHLSWAPCYPLDGANVTYFVPIYLGPRLRNVPNCGQLLSSTTLMCACCLDGFDLADADECSRVDAARTTSYVSFLCFIEAVRAHDDDDDWHVDDVSSNSFEVQVSIPHMKWLSRGNVVVLPFKGSIPMQARCRGRM